MPAKFVGIRFLKIVFYRVHFHLSPCPFFYSVDALAREAREELDIEVVDPRWLTSMQRTQHAAPIDERIDFFFTAREWRGEPRIMEPRKCAELRWWPLATLPEPMPPHEVEVLASLLGVALPGYCTLGFEREIR